MLLEYSIVAVLAYLLGSINSSIIVGKFYGIDIRNFGSGNAGASNTLRTLGKLATLLVLIGDVLKGVIAAYIGNEIAGGTGMLIGAFFSILGHNWPVYFGFKGGKGILTSLAVIFAIDWRVGLISAIIGVSIIAITRYISLGSIIGAVVLPFLFYFIKNYRDISQSEILIFSIIIAILAIWRHRANVVRLAQGSETKIGQKAKVENAVN